MPTSDESVWRLVAGPLVTAAVGAAFVLINHYVIWIPNASGFTFLATVFATYLGGVVPGVASAAITFGFGLFFLSQGRGLFSFDHEGALRFGTLLILTPLAVLLVSTLRARAGRALREEQASRAEAESSNRELLTLRAALDQVEDGIVLLDNDLRARFINQAYCRIWQLPVEVAASGPHLVELLRHGRAIRLDDIAHEVHEAYALDRITGVRAGDGPIRDLRLKDGEVYRFRSKRLPGGGAMLSYTDVTDLVHHADKLQELATIDGLTGIYNRRHFLSLAEREWNRFQRHERRLSLLLIDIDHFKTVNDRYGHDAGDHVLSAVARLCGARKRSADPLSRLGGEEFALLLPETDIVRATQAAERLCQEIAGTPVFAGPHAIEVTVSVGAAEADEVTRDFAALFKRADDALYEAKRNGRNRVVAWGTPAVGSRTSRLWPARAG
jgi:diguanylate cyclase (GGDEF)-like protein